MNHETETLLVGFDQKHGEDTAVLIVGKKRLNQSVEIINAFQGEEAIELYNRLITVKKKSGVTLDE